MDRNMSPVLYWLLGAAALLALVGVLFLEPGNSQEDPHHDGRCGITGTVADAHGRPVMAFALSAAAGDGRTPAFAGRINDPKGAFSFSLPPGTFTVRVTAEGFKPHEAPLVVSRPIDRLHVILHPEEH